MLPGDDTTLILADWFKYDTGSTKAIVLSCSDVARAAVQPAGRAPTSELGRDLLGRVFVFVDDPDGNQIVLMERS